MITVYAENAEDYKVVPLSRGMGSEQKGGAGRGETPLYTVAVFYAAD